VRNPDEQAARTGPSPNVLIRQVAARDHGYTPSPAAADTRAKLPLETVAADLQWVDHRPITSAVLHSANVVVHQRR
jgi:hypothetical protein